MVEPRHHRSAELLHDDDEAVDERHYLATHHDRRLRLAVLRLCDGRDRLLQKVLGGLQLSEYPLEFVRTGRRQQSRRCADKLGAPLRHVEGTYERRNVVSGNLSLAAADDRHQDKRHQDGDYREQHSPPQPHHDLSADAQPSARRPLESGPQPARQPFQQPLEAMV